MTRPPRKRRTRRRRERFWRSPADPVLDEDGQPVLRDGEPVYEQRNLNLSRGLLDALAELGYTHIRFAVKDAALEWQIADMTEDGSVVRLAPMGADERSQAEIEAMDGAEASRTATAPASRRWSRARKPT